LACTKAGYEHYFFQQALILLRFYLTVPYQVTYNFNGFELPDFIMD